MRISPVGPSSQIRPARITTARRQVVREQFEDGRLDRDVQRGGHLVAERQGGSGSEARITAMRWLSTRQFAGVAPGWAAASPTSSSAEATA